MAIRRITPRGRRLSLVAAGGDRLRVNREGVEHCVTGLCGEYNIKVGVLAMERGI